MYYEATTIILYSEGNKHMPEILDENGKVQVLPGLLQAQPFQFVGLPGLRMFGNPGPLLSALASAQAEFEPIVRTRKNPFFNSVYADLSDVLAACMPALNKHGLTLNQLPTRPDKTGDWTVYTILGHRSGSFWMLESVIPAAEWQKFGSALTYNRRYTDSAVLGVASEPDDDGNAADSKDDGKPGPRQGTRPTPPQQQKASPPPQATAVATRKSLPDVTDRGESRTAVASGGETSKAETEATGSKTSTGAVDSREGVVGDAPKPEGQSASSGPVASDRPLNDLLKDIGDALRGGRLNQTSDGEVRWFTKAAADELAKAKIGKPTTAISTPADAIALLAELAKLPSPTPKQREAYTKLRAKFGKDREQADLFCADVIGHSSDWVPNEKECDELLEALSR